MAIFSKILVFYLLLFFVFSANANPPDPPDFLHPAGTFEESFELELTAGEGATIYYTLDGQPPSRTSRQYDPDDPITVSGSVLIRARAYNEQEEAGEIETKIYSQLDHTVADFDSDLPLAIVHQFDETMMDQCDDPNWPSDCDRTMVNVSFIDRDDDGRARLLSDDLHLHSRSESNYRGSSSLGFPKRQFGVRFIDDQDENRNEPVLGMPSENNWILYAPYDDKTLMRNAVAYQLSQDMGWYAPRTRFVELFLHDGDGAVTEDHYHGVYMLVERIKWDDNRVNLTKIAEEDNSEPEITGGYIINYDRDVHFRSSYRNTGFALVRPQDWDITHQQRDWLSGYIGELEEALFGSDFRDSEDGYEAYLEPESFIDHHLITEALKEIDGYRLSTYMHKDRGGRLVMGPVWDYNISLGNGEYLEAWKPEGWYYPQINEEQYLNGWYSRLFEDPDFEQRYRERWWELRQGPFATEHIVNMIRDYAEKLDEAQERNFERWPILGEYVWPNHFIGDTYEEEVEYMIDWVEQRLDWIDDQMGPPPDNLPENQLVYYWHFGDELPNDTPFEYLDAPYALMDQARMRFNSALEGYPFEEGHSKWRKASMERRNQPTIINYRPEGNHGRPFDYEAMRALQVRQPFVGDGGENTLIFDLPTTGMENVVFQFAAMDEGAVEALLIDYSIASGETEWVHEALSTNKFSLSNNYQPYEIDFSDISEVDHNPDFKIRIRFAGENLSADDGDRVTFNNFSMESDGVATSVSPDGQEEKNEKSHSFELKPNYPNPFNPETSITYSISDRSEVTLTIYNVMGQKVKQLVDERKDAGEYTRTFDASGLASGVYIYELRTRKQQTSRTMTFIK